MRIRQSLTLSPKMASQGSNQTPQPQASGQARERPETQSTEPVDQESVETRDTEQTGAAEPTRGASRLSSQNSQDANIQFVEVQTLLFGETPPVLNPKTLFLKNHEPTKASQKKCGLPQGVGLASLTGVSLTDWW